MVDKKEDLDPPFDLRAAARAENNHERKFGPPPPPSRDTPRRTGILESLKYLGGRDE